MRDLRKDLDEFNRLWENGTDLDIAIFATVVLTEAINRALTAEEKVRNLKQENERLKDYLIDIGQLASDYSKQGRMPVRVVEWFTVIWKKTRAALEVKSDA